MAKGRPRKPLSQIIAEGGRIQNDRVNRDAPVPPAGPLEAPEDLTAEERAVWQTTVQLAAPGQIKPLDGGLLRQYCFTMAQFLRAVHSLREWQARPRETWKEGETDQLIKARNGELIPHPLFRPIREFQAQLRDQERDLGLNPVSREKIRASLQRDLFDDPDRAFDRYAPRSSGGIQ